MNGDPSNESTRSTSPVVIMARPYSPKPSPKLAALRPNSSSDSALATCWSVRCSRATALLHQPPESLVPEAGLPRQTICCSRRWIALSCSDRVARRSSTLRPFSTISSSSIYLPYVTCYIWSNITGTGRTPEEQTFIELLPIVQYYSEYWYLTRPYKQTQTHR